MEMTADDATGDQTIQLKQCPRCRVAIRRNLRYGTIINQLLADIELVSRGQTRGGCRTCNLTNNEFLRSHYINFREREVNKNTSRKTHTLLLIDSQENY